jgi:hypothetical protein
MFFLRHPHTVCVYHSDTCPPRDSSCRADMFTPTNHDSDCLQVNVTKQPGWHNGNTVGSCLGSALCESWLGQKLSWLDFHGFAESLQGNATIKLWLLPHNPFPGYQASYSLIVYSLDTDSIMKWPTITKNKKLHVEVQVWICKQIWLEDQTENLPDESLVLLMTLLGVMASGVGCNGENGEGSEMEEMKTWHWAQKLAALIPKQQEHNQIQCAAWWPVPGW